MSRFERFATLIHLAYLARFPLLVLLFVLAFRWIALNVVGTMLSSLYDLKDFWQNFFASLFTFLLAFTAASTLKIVLLYGGERVGFDAGNRRWVRRNVVRRLVCTPALNILAAVFGAIALSGSWNFIFQQETQAIWWSIIGQVLGFFAAGLLLLAASVFNRLLYPKRDAERLPNFLFPYGLFPFLNPIKKWADRQSFLSNIVQKYILPVCRPRFFESRICRIPPYFGRGYFRYNLANNVVTDKNGRVVLRYGHALATTMLGFFFLVYIVIGLVTPNHRVSAISYLMIILTVLCWFLSGAAFWFDRFRFPVSLAIGFLLFVASLNPQNDDFYTVRNLSPDDKFAVKNNKLTPREAYRIKPKNFQAPPEDYVILVAADGGGVQAAAWTAKVLTGLEKACRKKFGENFAGCAERIRLISSVSGGSVGAMHFINAYTENGLPDDDKELDNVAERAADSSLDPVAWGLAYPDLVHSVVPFRLFNTGRGQKLEEAWIKNGCNSSNTQSCALDDNLSRWREGVREGWRPANIFNATITETGERLLISTTDICETDVECRLRRSQINENSFNTSANCPVVSSKSVEFGTLTVGRRNFYDFTEGNDVSVATAARLSASFPYVTPAPRASVEDFKNHGKHIVDGGYYDNYGVSSLSEWLNEALNGERFPDEFQNCAAPTENAGEKPISKIMIVQIRGNSRSKSSEDKEETSGRGWYYQLVAPLLTFYNVRTTAQLSHNETELELLRNYWSKRGVEIQTAIFQYESGSDETSPLSWHLTDEQKDNIKSSWNRILCGEDKKYKGWSNFADFIKARHRLENIDTTFTEKECAKDK